MLTTFLTLCELLYRHHLTESSCVQEVGTSLVPIVQEEETEPQTDSSNLSKVIIGNVEASGIETGSAVSEPTLLPTILHCT